MRASENECYDDCGYSTDHFAYAVIMSNLKALQLQLNWLYVVPGPSGRKRYNVLAALNAVTREVIRVVGDLDRQDLQRNISAELGVPRSVHLAHAASANLGYDLVGSDAGADHGLMGF